MTHKNNAMSILCKKQLDILKNIYKYIILFQNPKVTQKENNITKQITKTQRPHLVIRPNTQTVRVAIMIKMNNYTKKHKSKQHLEQIKQRQQNDKPSL